MREMRCPTFAQRTHVYPSFNSVPTTQPVVGDSAQTRADPRVGIGVGKGGGRGHARGTAGSPRLRLVSHVGSF